MKTLKFLLPAAAILAFAGCQTEPKGPPTLKSAYRKDFYIGVAVNANQTGGTDALVQGIVLPNFNSVSPENALKMGPIHPDETNWNWEPADSYVNYGLSNHMFIVGHTLVWHAQSPAWIFRGTDGKRLGTNDADRALLYERLHNHIATLVGRYKGKIKVWDVVNETFADDQSGHLRRGGDEWTRILGTNNYEFIAKAFTWAHEADPDCILRYNDYNLDTNPRKRAACIAMIKTLRAQGVPIMAVGLQGHGNLREPTLAQEDATLHDFSQLDIQIMVTELDIDCSRGGQRGTTADLNANAANNSETNSAREGATNAPAGGRQRGFGGGGGRGAGGGPASLSPELQKQLAKRYSDMFQVFLKYKKNVKLVTFWGVDDAVSWRRQGNPLLFDREGKPKLAYQAVIDAAHGIFIPDAPTNAVPPALAAPVKTAMTTTP